MKLSHPIFVTSISVLLAACGGGGEDVASLPKPPTGQGNATLAELRVSQDFTAYYAQANYSLSRATGAASGKSSVQAPTEVRYDAASQSYTLVGTTMGTTIFRPADKLGDTAATTGYRKIAGNTQEDFVLFRPGAANPDMALTYASYGAWQKIVDKGTDLDVSTAFFTYGVTTNPSDMPKSGSATYQTRIDGQYADGTGAYVLSGASSFAANFAAGTVRFEMSPIGQHVVDGRTKVFGNLQLDGIIKTPNQFYKGNEFEASSDLNAAYSADLHGFFYGPGAAEMGGAFTLRQGLGNPEIGNGSGAVVGRKN
ncbi:transferrin-binding protein-like solute binding protein [Novosphingobium sp. ST904]|uniref:transferrin-binding protein-like solute binding protein n=1 Tax=Novosphingobium sp. ST904 TaxID=1684385 RepID=UPI0006C86658|nr:transferrin-binding protein-like solute binding protein [Novosphingobium sp. ST904]KPH64822.1 hypothetical protein ADT71_11140 [Novosphingobium sp. ST904]TCM34486.1 transferrin binding protein [Novosphingobium sp. ST904]